MILWSQESCVFNEMAREKTVICATALPLRTGEEIL